MNLVEFRKTNFVEEVKNNASEIWEVESFIDNTVTFKDNKQRYEDNAKILTIVAFYVNKDALFSGKIKEIHENHFVIETLNGTKFRVNKKNVAWYKTGSRWPKWVYQELKRKEKVLNDTKRFEFNN